MKKVFTKKDLHTGDIIVERNGDRGVVILEKGSILYQAGGLDVLDEVFTDDLFVDGPDRSGDIMKVYHNEEGPIGFNKLFGLPPVFVRKNDKYTKERVAELSEKYASKEVTVLVIVLEPCFRQYYEQHVDLSDQRRLDVDLSEAPSMTVLGQIKTDRTFIPIPHTDHLFLLYNKYQEEWHIQQDEGYKHYKKAEEKEPIVVIPEEDIVIHSRCMLVRKNDSGEIEDLHEGDFEKLEQYLIRMKKGENY